MVKEKVVEFEPYKKTRYCEEYQPTGFHYAFLSTDNKMCHHWIKCRDFLQDALRNQLTGRADAIYSFHYKPGRDPKVNTKRTMILVRKIPVPETEIAKKDFKEMMKYALRLVNHYEKVHKFSPRSKIIIAKEKGRNGDVYLFRGPGVWSQGPIMIAIYTFLIRLGHFKPVFSNEKSLQMEYNRIINSQKQTNDTRYLKLIHKNLHLAIEHRNKHLFKRPGWKKGDKILFHDSNMSSFHHHSGIVSLSQFNTPVKELNDEFRKIFGKAK